MQVVGYDTGVPEGPAALQLARDGAVSRLPLEPADRIDLSLGQRHCAGQVTGETHRPCDRPAAPHCERHAETWICARCTGTCLKDEMDCHEPHAVYLAAFAPATVKVGVTRSWRLETRLREQGADRGARIHEVSNGRIAREIEADLADRIPDRVGIGPKIAGLHRSVDEAVWSAALADVDVQERFALEYGLALDRRPVRETMATGTVRGVKGRVLVLEHRDTVYAVDLRDLVGHEVDAERGPQSLQSSLGAFASSSAH